MTKRPPPITTGPYPSPPEAPPEDKPKSHKMTINAWPVERESQGVGLSVKDGWNFGIGFGVAMAIAVPLILLFVGCAAAFALAYFGSSLGALL